MVPAKRAEGEQRGGGGGDGPGRRRHRRAARGRPSQLCARGGGGGVAVKSRAVQRQPHAGAAHVRAPAKPRRAGRSSHTAARPPPHDRPRHADGGGGGGARCRSHPTDERDGRRRAQRQAGTCAQPGERPRTAVGGDPPVSLHKQIGASAASRLGRRERAPSQAASVARTPPPHPTRPRPQPPPRSSLLPRLSCVAAESLWLGGCCWASASPCPTAAQAGGSWTGAAVPWRGAAEGVVRTPTRRVAAPAAGEAPAPPPPPLNHVGGGGNCAGVAPARAGGTDTTRQEQQSATGQAPWPYPRWPLSNN